MRIARVTFSLASQAGGGPVQSLSEFEGRAAEAQADELLQALVARDRVARPSQWVRFLVTLENGASWDVRQDLDYTYAINTVRGLVDHAAQLEEFYGDACTQARDFHTALHGDE